MRILGERRKQGVRLLNNTRRNQMLAIYLGSCCLAEPTLRIQGFYPYGEVGYSKFLEYEKMLRAVFACVAMRRGS